MLPRLGVRLSLPSDLREMQWLGRGPDEAYADTGRAARIGRFVADVMELQTPYVFPQENGNRADVRWATFTALDGHGLRVDADGTLDVTLRPWTTEDLDAATHTADLRDRGSYGSTSTSPNTASGPPHAAPACSRSTTCVRTQRPRSE